MTDTKKAIEAAKRLGYEPTTYSVIKFSDALSYDNTSQIAHWLLVRAILDRKNWGVEFFSAGETWAELRDDDGEVAWQGPREELPMAIITKFLEETEGEDNGRG